MENFARKVKMTERLFPSIAEAEAYVTQLNPQVQDLLLLSEQKLGLLLLGTSVKIDTLLDAVATADRPVIANIQNLPSQDKIMLAYAVAKQRLEVFSPTELISLLKVWPEQCAAMLLMLNQYLSFGEVNDGALQLLESGDTYTGTELEELLDAMAAPDFIYEAESTTSPEDIFLGHWLTIMLKLRIEVLSILTEHAAPQE